MRFTFKVINLPFRGVSGRLIPYSRRDLWPRDVIIVAFSHSPLHDFHPLYTHIYTDACFPFTLYMYDLSMPPHPPHRTHPNPHLRAQVRWPVIYASCHQEGSTWLNTAQVWMTFSARGGGACVVMATGSRGQVMLRSNEERLPRRTLGLWVLWRAHLLHFPAVLTSALSLHTYSCGRRSPCGGCTHTGSIHYS